MFSKNVGLLSLILLPFYPQDVVRVYPLVWNVDSVTHMRKMLHCK